MKKPPGTGASGRSPGRARLTRAEQKAATRRRLLDAAQEVFSRRGYHGASVDEVAAAAGYTKGAVYSHFGSKENLFLALLDERLSQQYAAAEEISGIADRRARDAQWHAQAREAFIDTADWALLGLEFLLYAVRERPDLRDQLAARYRQADAWMSDLLERQYRARGSDPPGPVALLALIHTALGEGLFLRRLVDPDTITMERLNAVYELLFPDR